MIVPNSLKPRLHDTPCPRRQVPSNLARRMENHWFSACAEMTTCQLLNVAPPRLHTEFAVTRIRPRLLTVPNFSFRNCLTPL